MKRTILLALAALLMVPPAILHAANGPGSERPNLLLIYCDDLGWGDVGFNGHPIIKTRNIDSLASQGMVFNDNYAGAPHCSPSRVALMLGKASYRVGMYDIMGRGDMEMPEKETTLAELLRGAGYATYHAGKWHMSKEPQGGPAPALRHGFEYSADPGIATSIVADFARWLNAPEAGDKPFFAYLAFHESHEPVEKWSPESFRKAYQPIDEERFKTIRYGGDRVERKKAMPDHRACYYGCVAQLDSAIGELVKLLRKRGVYENTFIYFSSDNGPEHRAAHSWGTPGAFRGAKGHLHEGGIRVPGFAVWPGHIQTNGHSDAPIHAWDVLPTFAELAGVRPALKLDGVSFLPATRGVPLERRTPLYWSWYDARGGVNYVMRDGDWKICGIAEPRPASRTVVEHIKQGGFAGFELYNLKDDPNENHDLAASRPEILDRLKSKLLALHREIAADGPVLRMDGDPAGKTSDATAPAKAKRNRAVKKERP